MTHLQHATRPLHQQPAAAGSLSAPGTAAAPALTVYFDGSCPVCSREIAVYRQQPGADRCAWVDASRCDEAELGAGLGRAQALAQLHVRGADGNLRAGVQGFAAMWAALPRTAWLGRLAGWPPVTALLEVAYRVFLRVRPLWRAPAADAPPASVPPSASLDATVPAAATASWPAAVVADLRSDHAGEVGAVQIYRGILAVSSDPAVRAFAARHLQTEQQHLACIERHLPAAARSRLLPAWRVAGWLTGALPALAGPRAVYLTVAAVETFVDRHYAEQIAHLDALLARPRLQGPGSTPAVAPGKGPLADGEAVHTGPDLHALRQDLAACREDELNHLEEARAAAVHPGGAPGPYVPGVPAPADGWLARAWAAAVGAGSVFAVTLARRI